VNLKNGLRQWQKYYQLLKTDTHVILDGDFFIPGDATMVIGNSIEINSTEDDVNPSNN